MKCVIYYRVSDKFTQGQSGLGLAAQETDCQLFLSNYSGECIGEFTDMQTGKDLADSDNWDLSFNDVIAQRPEFKKALKLCKKTGASLLVAKLDRVGRDVEICAAVMKRVNLKVACMPEADNMQLQIYATLAEQERRFISQRTKAAAKAKTEREHAKGNTEYKYGSEGGEVIRQKTIKSYQKLIDAGLFSLIESGLQAGFKFQEIADSLNESGLSTVKGGSWGATQVSRVLKLFEIDYLDVKKGQSIVL